MLLYFPLYHRVANSYIEVQGNIFIVPRAFLLIDSTVPKFERCASRCATLDSARISHGLYPHHARDGKLSCESFHHRNQRIP